MLFPFPSRQACLLGAAVCLSLSAQASESIPADINTSATDSRVGSLDSIHVTGTRQQRIALETVPMDVLTGRALNERRAATLGETVSRIPGVQNGYFGPAAGRPLIRGQSGERVALEINGLTSRDSSALSGDRAVPVEPFLADAIEVQKGPAVILHGSDAIGGVLNVVDGRIPQQLGDEPLSGRAELSGGDNAGTVGMLRLDGSSGQWAWHADALRRKVSDVSIPGGTKADACRNWDQLVDNTQVQLLCQVRLGPINWQWDPATGRWVDATAPEDQLITDRAPGESGKLRGSALTTNTLTLGGSRIGDQGMVGMAVNHYDTRYGVPGFGYAPNRFTTPQPIALDLRQTRYDLHARSQPDSAVIEQIQARLGYTRASDRESIAGIDHTRLDSTALDMRIEARHTPVAGFSGRFGVHSMRRKIATGGIEAYLPSLKVNQDALFWMEEFTWNRLQLTAGVRWEHSDHDVDPDTIRPGRGIGSAARDREDSTFNRAYAARYRVIDGLHLVARYDHAERAPSVMELFANGNHFAILSEEQGSYRLQKETAHHGELGLELARGRYTLTAHAYRTRYDNYLYLGYTGVVRALPVREWKQGDTRMRGLEVEASVRWELSALGNFSLDGFMDKVDVRPVFTMPEGYDPFDWPPPPVTSSKWDGEYFRKGLDGDYLPRTPVSRAGLGLSWSKQALRASVGAVYHERQNKLAANEVRSEAYTLVDAHAAWQFSAPGGEWEAFLDISNLTDREARPHHSFFRYRAPLSGRAVALGVRLYF